MLSLFTLTSSVRALDYYEKDYYVDDGIYSEWVGKGAERLGLSGAVGLADFKALLNGILPSDHIKANTSDKRYRPGYDLTFSAPKSLSILALIGKDQRVLEAHRKAVQAALETIEREYGATRVRSGERVSIEKTKNLIFATFEHETSREEDPQLHTHCVLQNLTQTQDGKWRAIFGDKIYKDKILLGMIYRSHLAKELSLRGYQVEKTGEQGIFEIKGVPKDLIDHFSKRRSQIVQKMKEEGVQGGKAASVANFETRKGKAYSPKERLQEQWKAEFSACGYDPSLLKEITEEALERGPIKTSIEQVTLQAEGAISAAVTHLGEWRAHFRIEEALKSAREFSDPLCLNEHLIAAWEKMISDEAVVSIGAGNFTTKEVMILNQENVRSLQEGTYALASRPLMSQQRVLNYVQYFNLDTEIKQALVSALSSPAQQHVLQVNKDIEQAFLQTLSIFKDTKVPVIGITASYQKKEALEQKGTFRYVITIDRFLEHCERKKGFQQSAWGGFIHASPRVWVIDSKSDCSVTQIRQIQQAAQHQGAKVVWCVSRSSSLPLKSLLTATEQKLALPTETSALEVFAQAKEHSRVHEIATYQERLKAAAVAYVEHKEKEKEQGPVALIALTHASREALNGAVRAEMLARAELGQDKVLIPTLQKVVLGSEQKRSLYSYQLGDVLFFKKDFKRLKVASGSFAKVVFIEQEARRLILERPDGSRIVWLPQKSDVKATEVFIASRKELRVGDSIRWTKNLLDSNGQPKRVVSDSAEVIAVTSKGAMVRASDGSVSSLASSDIEMSEKHHWEYAYATILASSFSRFEKKQLLFYHNESNLGSKLTNWLEQSFEAGSELQMFCRKAADLENTLKTSLDHHLDSLPLKPQEQEPNAQEVVFQEFQKTGLGDFSRVIQIELALLEKDQDLFIRCAPELIEPRATTVVTAEQEVRAMEAVDFYCAKISERAAIFDLNKAEKEVFKEKLKSISYEDIRAQFQRALEQGLLIRAGVQNESKGGNSTFVTTRANLALEKACIQLMQDGQKVLQPLFTKEHPYLKGIVEHELLTKGQKEAVMLSLTTQDRVIGVQGVPGSGKTTMLKEVHRLSQTAGIQLIGMAGTAKARDRMHEAIGTSGPSFSCMTLQSFLIKSTRLLAQDPALAKQEYGINKLLVVDEASLVSTKQLFQLLYNATQLDTRVLLVGDVRQKESIGAGKAFFSLIGNKMATAVMNETLRLKSPEALERIKALYTHNIPRAIEAMGEHCIVIEDKEERFGKMAELYLAKTKEERQQTLMITPLNEERTLLNGLIREGLKAEGTLQGEELQTQVLLPASLTETEQGSSFGIKVGQVLRFNFAHQRHGIQLGDYAFVEKKVEGQHQFVLALKGKKILWSPERQGVRSGMGIEVFNPEQKAWMVGDLVRCRRNDPTRGLCNGQLAEITALEGTKATLKIQDKEVLTIDFAQKEESHWDHAYAATTFVAQGQDVRWTIGHAQAASEKQLKTGNLPKTTNVSDLLVQATRGDSFILFTDNKERLIQTLERQKETKHNALETLDPKWSQVKARVQDLTSQVVGHGEQAHQRNTFHKKEHANQDNPHTKQPATSNDLSETRLATLRLEYLQASPIKGTLAEKYLREHGGCKNSLPKDCRFSAQVEHPLLAKKMPALLMPIKDAQGLIQGVKQIFLEQDGSKLHRYYHDALGRQKRIPAEFTVGRKEQGTMVIQKASKGGGMVWLVEDFEKALKIAQQRPQDTVLAQSSPGVVSLSPKYQQIVLCVEQKDLEGPLLQKTVQKIAAYQEQKLKVFVSKVETRGAHQRDPSDPTASLVISNPKEAVLQKAAEVTEKLKEQSTVKQRVDMERSR